MKPVQFTIQSELTLGQILVRLNGVENFKKCRKHPGYKAKKEPSASCTICYGMWILAEEARENERVPTRKSKRILGKKRRTVQSKR